MNTQSWIKLAFGSLSDRKFQETCDNIIRGMTGNENFPMLSDSLTEVEDLYGAYKQTLRSKEDRSIASATIKEKQKMLVVPALQKLAHGVMAVTGNDRSILETTGFNLRAEPVKKTVPDTPENVRVYLTNDVDAILVICKADRNAKVYKVEVSEDMKDWRLGNAADSCKVPVTNLPVGKILYARMAAKNSLGHSTWSEPELFRIPASNEPKMKRKNVNVVS